MLIIKRIQSVYLTMRVAQLDRKNTKLLNNWQTKR